MTMHFNPARPDQTPGLTDIIERGTKPVRYISRYFATDGEVPCAFCAARTLHRKGFLVEMEDGRIALCGRDCAREFFGDEVAGRLFCDLRSFERRAINERLLLDLLQGVDPVLLAIRSRWDPLEVKVDAAINHRFWSRGHESLRSRISESGTLDRTHVTPKWVEVMRPDGTTYMDRQDKVTVVGQVKAASILSLEPGLLRRAARELIEIKLELSEDWQRRIPDRQIAVIAKKRTQAIRLIERGLHRLELARIFFDSANISELNLWLRDEGIRVQKLEWRVRAAGPVIILKLRDGSRHEVDVPDLSKLPTEAELIDPLRPR